MGKFINDIKRASEDIKTEINKEADRQEREKKLSEYKAQMEKDLGNTAEDHSEKTSEENK